MDKQQLEKHLSERFKGTKNEMIVEVNKYFPAVSQKMWVDGGRHFSYWLTIHEQKGGDVVSDNLCEENIANAHLLANAYPLLVAAMKLQFLNGCEEEGISSGMPTVGEWREAFEDLENVITKIIDYDKT